jgi:hypothetical protein
MVARTDCTTSCPRCCPMRTPTSYGAGILPPPPCNHLTPNPSPPSRCSHSMLYIAAGISPTWSWATSTRWTRASSSFINRTCASPPRPHQVTRCSCGNAAAVLGRLRGSCLATCVRETGSGFSVVCRAVSGSTLWGASQGTVVINQSYDQDTNDLHKVPQPCPLPLARVAYTTSVR